jgi:hypothetical protein
VCCVNIRLRYCGAPTIPRTMYITPLHGAVILKTNLKYESTSGDGIGLWVTALRFSSSFGQDVRRQWQITGSPGTMRERSVKTVNGTWLSCFYRGRAALFLCNFLAIKKRSQHVGSSVEPITEAHTERRVRSSRFRCFFTRKSL